MISIEGLGIGRRLPSGRPGQRVVFFASALLLASSSGSPIGAGVSFGVNNVLTVSQASGCAGLLSVLDGIRDAWAFGAYVIRLEPGFYNCGSVPIVMKPWVDLEGAGQKATIIQGAGPYSIKLAQDSELRSLTVLNYSPSSPTALLAETSRATIRDVYAFAQPGPPGLSVALIIATSSIDGAFHVTESRLHGGSEGLAINQAGFIRINRSTIEGLVSSAFVGAAASVRFDYSELIGRVDNGGGAVSCVYSYNGATLSPLSVNCL